MSIVGQLRHCSVILAVTSSHWGRRKDCALALRYYVHYFIGNESHMTSPSFQEGWQVQPYWE